MVLHHVDRGGAGRPVVLLHAFPLDSRMFDRLVPLIDDRARVVTIDLPGLGGSQLPRTEPSMETVADAVLEVLDRLGIDSAVMFGISTGGYVALQVATSAPGRLTALVLGSTTPHVIRPDVPDERLVVAREVDRLHSTEPVSDSADEGLGDTAHREQPGLVDGMRRAIADADPAGVAWMARAIARRHDTAAALRAYDGRVVLLFGEEDDATPPARGEEMLALRGGADTSLVILERTGHLTPLESPEEVAAVVLDLLAAIDGDLR